MTFLVLVGLAAVPAFAAPPSWDDLEPSKFRMKVTSEQTVGAVHVVVSQYTGPNVDGKVYFVRQTVIDGTNHQEIRLAGDVYCASKTLNLVVAYNRIDNGEIVNTTLEAQASTVGKTVDPNGPAYAACL
jgi:hypothetical protein